MKQIRAGGLEVYSVIRPNKGTVHACRRPSERGPILRRSTIYIFDKVVTVRGRDFHVVGDISPAERASWGYDGGYPGCPAYMEDVSIKLIRGKKEREVLEKDETKEGRAAWSKLWNEIESAVFESLED